MDTQNTSAPPRARSAPAGNPTRSRHHTGGVIHDNTRHTERFVVIGNHLTQHPELSLVAIGLACHIQSLPTGTPVDIKSLAARFKEGTKRIADALRELETHGYLRRERVRTPTGHIITRTTSCNQPHHRREPAPTDRPSPARPGNARPSPVRQPGPVGRAHRDLALGAARRRPDGVGDRGAVARVEEAGRAALRQRAPHPHPTKEHTPQPHPRKTLPAVPQPSCTAPALLQQATDLLTGLRSRDPRLLLSATDTAHLAPGVAAWLEREVTPTSVRHALTDGLPDEHLHRPAALLAHRLTARLPPPPPFRAPATPPPPRHQLRNCDGCDRAFRVPETATETHCRSCRSVTLHP
ncbi:helix-turn-helix domain-containing protein [Streptomyces sp. NPDC018964]|uniref:helix-turn-helix domain-containing protein n=1 Tax=Streptomyces sp. NPDC018964 TaxID=3365058 RepID=UPI0037A1D291